MKNITYISASAGSGKTYELTERLKKVILEGKAKPEEVILTTFTKAAASEFKEKAKAKFYEVGKVKEANRLDQALIGTVDSVANVFVNKYWYLLGISPKQNVISQEDEEIYVSESLSSLPTDEQTKFFNSFAETFKIPEEHEDGKKYGIDYGFWKKDLKKIFDATRNFRIRDYKESVAKSKELIKIVTQDCCKLNFDREELLDKLEAVELIDKSAEAQTDSSKLRLDLIANVKRIINRSDSSRLEIGMELYNMVSNKKFSNTKKFTENSPEYQDLVISANKVWICEEVRELQFKYVENLFEIAKRWQEKYIKYKKEQHIIDYTDMEEYLLELITNSKYECVQEDIQASYKYLFVDEFQDCSPTQIKIFDRLSELVEQSIWVGDYKQAIYGFRGSDTALVKAVTDRIERLNGKPNDTLSTSHRSWPEIVNVCNSVFVPAFSDILREEEVMLNPWDKLVKKAAESGKKNLLKCWTITEKKKDKKAAQIAGNIAKMVQEGIKPKDIAVLARTNNDTFGPGELTSIALALKEYNIPTLIGDNEFKVSREINLLNSLLSLVVNPADTMARATIAFLTKEGYGAAEILDRRFEDLSNNKKDSDYFEEIPLIQKLIEKRNNYKSLSVSALVENLIIELDLYNIVKSWPDSDNSVNTFHTVISIAKTYEDHCIQMSLPCTIYGFIDYISTVKIKAAGMSDGVQLFTYHGSKGLEWKNVILVSLEEDILDDTKMISREFYGVHASHEVEPNADNPYPPMMISVLPWIFGSLKKIPENVQNMIFANSKDSLKRKIIQEEKRLMYVAMTRPVESLILVSNKNDGLLRLKKLGVRAVDSIPAQENADILGIGKNFVIENPCDLEGWKFNTPESKVIGLCGENKNYRKRDQQPSTCKPSKIVKAEIVYDSGSRITLKSSEEEMNKIGTCLHNIFCVLEQNPTEAQAFEIIKNHEMSLALPNASEILTAWTNLESFMTNKYGAKNATFHELPFKQYYEGQIFTGSIDFIWETSDGGVVLVDFKSYPGSKDDVVNPEHKHYAGIYAGQFECYERALTAAGKKVLAKLLYYYVLGVIVKLD